MGVEESSLITPVSGRSPVSALDAVLEAARRLERAETVQAERIAKDQVRTAINEYDALVSRVARALGAPEYGDNRAPK